MKKKLLACLILTSLAGCNSNSSDTVVAPSSPVAPSTYTFIDEPVKGLFYQTATQTGCTDENGQYKALSTEEVKFYLGKCDDDNQVVTADTDSIQVGFVANPSEITTPYDLKIKSGSSTIDVNPITIATIMKSINRSSDSTILDLTGIKFTGNGADIKADIKTVIEDPSKAATTVLTPTVFNDLKQANRDSQKSFKQTKFLDETTVKTELSKTLKDLAKTKEFSASELAGKYIVSSDNTVYYFGPSNNTKYSDSIGEHGTSGAKHTQSMEVSLSVWGILTKEFSEQGTIGDLYISDGVTVERVLDNTNHWMVQKTASSKTLEKWTKGVVISDLAKLTGDYTSIKSSQYVYTFTTKIDNGQFTITQTTVDKDPNVPSNFVETSAEISTINLGKDNINLTGDALNFTIIPLATDGSKIALMVNQKLSNDEYHLVDILTK